jgi:hypothetical protein
MLPNTEAVATIAGKNIGTATEPDATATVTSLQAAQSRKDPDGIIRALTGR